MITVTLIRHGESTDNLRSVWAGWADAPLSNHGMNQARALGEAFANTRLTEIYTSPLKRAFTTAKALCDAQPEPKPSFHVSPLLKEQNFGKAEGAAWTMRRDPDKTLEEHFANGQYPVLYDRDQKFPDGESLDELAMRADRAINELVLPHIWQAARVGSQDIHIALGERSREAMDFGEGDCPPLLIEVTAFNRHEHINAIKRQQGGIGSMAYDPKQQNIRDFFGGKTVKQPVEALEHSESNAMHEVQLEKN
ncbi:hypothetical protein ID866_1450 [Astraeus odoratus]|nr:hypothetical protein ID866_1450 [Astraeus odoratus]